MEFQKRVSNKIKEIQILQLNIGKMCNLSCDHCHVEASSKRQERMTWETFEKAMRVFDQYGLSIIDFTGGEPTLHPDFPRMAEKAAKRAEKIIVRTNGVGLHKREDLIHKLVDYGVDLVLSMPCYTKDNVDRMRGQGTFDAVVQTIKVLNKWGYGNKHTLDLVYNPGGAFLPPSQAGLEGDYKRELEKLGLEFSNLLTITNIPIGFFKERLEGEGAYDSYMKLLKDNFNEGTVDGIMCRYQISVGYDGRIYDCDFNQMEGLVVKEYSTLDELLDREDLQRKIIFENFCYGCTAGAGSSCGGALNG